jgi:hypothetical protein
MFTTIGMLRRMTGMTLSLYFFKKFSFIAGGFFAGAFFSAEKPAEVPKNRLAMAIAAVQVCKRFIRRAPVRCVLFVAPVFATVHTITE